MYLHVKIAKKYYNKPNFETFLFEGAKDFLKIQDETIKKLES